MRKLAIPLLVPVLLAGGCKRHAPKRTPEAPAAVEAPSVPTAPTAAPAPEAPRAEAPAPTAPAAPAPTPADAPAGDGKTAVNLRPDAGASGTEAKVMQAALRYFEATARGDVDELMKYVGGSLEDRFNNELAARGKRGLSEFLVAGVAGAGIPHIEVWSAEKKGDGEYTVDVSQSMRATDGGAAAAVGAHLMVDVERLGGAWKVVGFHPPQPAAHTSAPPGQEAGGPGGSGMGGPGGPGGPGGTGAPGGMGGPGGTGGPAPAMSGPGGPR